jgi:hypothetical protein
MASEILEMALPSEEPQRAPRKRRGVAAPPAYPSYPVYPAPPPSALLTHLLLALNTLIAAGTIGWCIWVTSASIQEVRSVGQQNSRDIIKLNDRLDKLDSSIDGITKIVTRIDAQVCDIRGAKCDSP